MTTPKYTPIVPGTATKPLANIFDRLWKRNEFVPAVNTEEALGVPSMNFGKAGEQAVTRNVPVPPICANEEALAVPMLNFAKSRPAQAPTAPEAGDQQALGLPAMAF